MSELLRSTWIRRNDSHGPIASYLKGKKLEKTLDQYCVSATLAICERRECERKRDRDRERARERRTERLTASLMPGPTATTVASLIPFAAADSGRIIPAAVFCKKSWERKDRRVRHCSRGGWRCISWFDSVPSQCDVFDAHYSKLVHCIVGAPPWRHVAHHMIHLKSRSMDTVVVHQCMGDALGIHGEGGYVS